MNKYPLQESPFELIRAVRGITRFESIGEDGRTFDVEWFRIHAENAFMELVELRRKLDQNEKETLERIIKDRWGGQ